MEVVENYENGNIKKKKIIGQKNKRDKRWRIG